jgi:hypothetical protein
MMRVTNNSTNLTAMLAALFLLLNGCGPSKELREVQELRKSGKYEDARLRAVLHLQDTPERKEFWPEFALCVAAQSRTIERDGDDPLPSLVQAATAMSAMYKFKQEKPAAEWAEAGRMVSGEIVRLANIELSNLSRDKKAADYLQTLSNMQNPDGSLSARQMDAYRAVEAAQHGSRARLERIVIMETFITALPGLSATSGATLLEQLTRQKAEWLQALNIKPEFSQPIIAGASQRVEQAISRALGDLTEVGYLLPESILENGVY